MKAFKVASIVIAVVLTVAAGLYFSGYGGQLFMQAFLAYNTPSEDFDPARTAPAPDYGAWANWAALPDMSDLADLVPSGIESPPQGQQPVDTFFIHPTAYLKSATWTSPMDPDSGTEENVRWMMANQASAYNGCCNVYAPRFREATIFSYFGPEDNREKVLGFAYQDVKRAFEYYLQHYNQGRPFIIASHSQGTRHAMRLLKEVIDTSDLHERMVAGYLIGSIILPLPTAWVDSMTHISVCQSAEDLHCVVHWDTMPEGTPGLVRSEESLCTNPLSWRVDGEMASADLNEGAVAPEGMLNMATGPGADVPTDQVFRSLGKPQKGLTWAQCREGSLFVERQDGTAFEAMGATNMGSYHGLDYALFYMNIYDNAILRSSVYLAGQKTN